MIELTLQEYLALLSTEERDKFRRAVGYGSNSMLSQAATGHRGISANKAVLIEELTFGLVPRHVTRPKTFAPPRQRGRVKQTMKFIRLVESRIKENCNLQ